MSSSHHVPGPRTSALNVAVIDDHPLLRAGLVNELTEYGHNVYAQAETACAALDLILADEGDVYILDMVLLNNGHGLDVIRNQNLCRARRRKILVLTAAPDDDEAKLVLQLGVGGYLAKTSAGTALCHAVTDVAAGRTVIEPGMAGAVISALANPRARVHVTAREGDVLNALASGKTKNEDIAAQLFVSPATVRTHIDRLYTKFDVHDRAGLLSAALAGGYVSMSVVRAR